MFWLVVERAGQLGVTAVVAVIAARHYGPAKFGILSVAAATIALLTPFIDFAQGVLVKDFALHPRSAGVLAGSAMAISSAVATMAAAALLGLWLIHERQLGSQVLAIYGIGLLARPGFILDLWFQSRLLSRSAVFARLTGYALGAGFRVSALILSASLLVFATATWIETAVAVCLYFILAQRSGFRVRDIRLRVPVARRLMHECYPLVLSGIAIAVYMRLDQLMVAAYLGERSVGLYSAAVKLVELPYFLATVAMTSLLPGLSRARVMAGETYVACMRALLAAAVLSGLLIGALIALVGPFVVGLTFGSGYAGAVPPLRILALCVPAVFVGVAQSIWVINEGLQRIMIWRTLGGACVMVGANAVLMPTMGLTGAAIAAVLAQWWVGVISNGARRRTRPLLLWTFDSLRLWKAYSMLRQDLATLLRVSSDLEAVGDAREC